MSGSKHNCGEEIRRDDWALSGYRIEGDLWTCACGKRFEYVEDEAEGGGWFPTLKQKGGGV